MSFLKIEYIKKLLLSIISISITNIFSSKKNKISNTNKNDKSVPPYLDRHVLRKFFPLEEVIKAEIGFNNPPLNVLYCLKYIIYDLVLSIHMIL